MLTWSYPLIMLAALGTAWLLLRRYQSSLGLTSAEKGAVGLGAFCGAMIGAKLPFAFYDWEALRSGSAWLSNGKTILCGMVGAYVGVELAKWIAGIKTKTGDSFAVPAAVAVGIGRLSCYVAGCCHGIPTSQPWGIVFPAIDAVPRHPTQLYESAFHWSMAGLLAWMIQRGIWRGQLVKFYIMSYLVYRWWSEWLRPEPTFWYGMTAYQWFALICLPAFGLLWMRDARLVAHASFQSPTSAAAT